MTVKIVQNLPTGVFNVKQFKIVYLHIVYEGINSLVTCALGNSSDTLTAISAAFPPT